jgi:hypothetical protein
VPSYLLSDRRLRRGARPTPSATEQYGTSRRYDGTKRRRAADARPVRSCRRGARRRPCSTEVSFDAQRSLAYRSIAIVVPSGPTFVSSRIRPASDRETSRIVANGWSNPSAGQGPDRCIAAGSEPGLENTLKVETRVRTPLGLRRQTCRSQAKFGATSAMNRRLLARLIRKYPAAAQRSPSAPYVWLCRTVPIASRPVPSSPSTCGQGAVSPPAEGGVTPISLTSRGNAFG